MMTSIWEVTGNQVTTMRYIKRLATHFYVIEIIRPGTDFQVCKKIYVLMQLWWVMRIIRSNLNCSIVVSVQDTTWTAASGQW